MKLGRLRTVDDRVAEVLRLADLYGWEAETSPVAPTGIQIIGTRTDRHPDAAEGIEFGFSVVFAVNPKTGRAVTLCLDGNPQAAVVIVVGESYWHGPLSSIDTALEDPEGWTGVTIPAPPEVDS